MTTHPEGQVPDPNGPPVLSYASPKVGRRVVKAAVIAAVGGSAAVATLFFVATSIPRATSGALRSTRIKWEQRQNEIAVAVAAAPSDAGETPASKQPESTHD